MRNHLPKYRRHSNGQAFVAHRSINRPQNRQYLGKYGTAESRREYTRVIGEIQKWMEEQESGASEKDVVGPGGLTVVRLLGKFLSHIEETFGRESSRFDIASASCGASCPIHDLYAGLPAREFGPLKMAAVRDAWIERGLSRASINKYVEMVRLCFRWAVSNELVDASVWHALTAMEPLRSGRSKAKDKPKVQPVSWDSVKDLMPFMSDELTAIVTVQFWCGMRPQDVCRLCVEDIDRSGEVWLYRPPDHKGSWRGQMLVKAIPSVAQAVLSPLVEARESGIVFRKRSRRVAAISTANYRDRVKDAIARAREAGADVEDWTPNQLRHGIATMISDRFGAQAAQRFLGHRNLQTTGIYAQAQEAELIRIAMQVDTLARELGKRSPDT